MGRLLDAAVTADPTAGVHRLPQPFRMIDKILSGVVDDAADKAVARERRRLARLGIVEGTKMYRPVAETVELEHAATCVCVARFEDDEVESAERATGDARTAREARATRETEDDEDENATSTSRPRVVVFAGDEDGCVLAVDAATGAVLGRVAAFPGRAIAAVTAATVAPPPPEDETFWRAIETKTRKENRDDDASADPAPNEDDEDRKGDAPKEEGADEKDPAEEEIDDKNKTNPVVPLFDIAAAAGGPTPRDATPAMIVAAACADAARAYTFDASSTRFTPLCAAPTPAGSTPASLRLAPDGRTLALAAGGGALAAYEVPPPKPDAFLPDAETNADEDGADADGETTRSNRVVPDDVERDETHDSKNAFGSGSESLREPPAQTHEDGAFAAATPLVWLEAARAAAAFGAAPVRAPGHASRASPEVSAGDEEGADATDATDAEPSAADAEEHEKEDVSEAGDAATKTKTLSSPPDEKSAGAPDAYFRLDAAGRADALMVAWPGCNRAAMFSVRGALDALSVAAHRHDTVPALRGERDANTEATAEDDAAEPEPEPEPSPADDDAEATSAAATSAAAAASAAYSTPACDWTTPFPVTASAAVSDGEVSLFALGLVDGTVLVIDARLGVVAARLDRLGTVALRGTSQVQSGFFSDGGDGDAQKSLSRDASFFGDGDGPQLSGAVERLPSLTACVALAFARREENETRATVELTAASAEGWTATYAFPYVAPGALVLSRSSFPKNPRASRLARPRGDPHVAASLTRQRGGPFAVVEGDAPDKKTRRRSDEDEDDASGSESERDDGVSDGESRAVEKKTFVRAMDVTGAETDLYGVFCPPERCAFALDARGRTILYFDGSNTVVAVSRERQKSETNTSSVAEGARDAFQPADEKKNAEPERDEDDATEPAERLSGVEASGEDDPAALDPPASRDPPVCVTHTTHTKLCVYAVPRGVHAQKKSSPATPSATDLVTRSRRGDETAETAESVFFSSRLDGVVSARTSPKRSFSPGKPSDAHGADVGICSRRWQHAASAARLARILSARGGPEARRERFPKRLAELERKFERRAAEGGRPRAALGAH